MVNSFSWNGAELLHPFINGERFHAAFYFALRLECSSARLLLRVHVLQTPHYIAARPRVAAENLRAAACYHECKMLCERYRLPVNLLGKSAEELRAFMQSLGEPAYRGAQIYHALYAERRFDFAAMSNLPAALRERLAREACDRAAADRAAISRRRTARCATLLALGEIGRRAKPATSRSRLHAGRKSPDDLHFDAGGLRGGLPFLPDGARSGLIRNLTAGEIVGQVLVALEDNRAALKPQTNVVLMGQGEPLLNYEPVMAALRILLDPKGVAIAPRHVTLSTSGIVPGIERLAREKVRPKLAISLNASSNEQRDEIMPINRKYPLEDLLDAAARYPLGPREHLDV